MKSLEQLDEADAASVFGSFGSMSQHHPPEHSYRNQFARRSRQRNKDQMRTMHTVATATPEHDMKVVTYSPSHTVVPTYECFNKCSYCNFRKVPSGDQSGWVNLEEVDRQLRHLAEQGIVSEGLVLSGEVHPGRYVCPLSNCGLIDPFTPFPMFQLMYLVSILGHHCTGTCMCEQ